MDNLTQPQNDTVSESADVDKSVDIDELSDEEATHASPPTESPRDAPLQTESPRDESSKELNEYTGGFDNTDTDTSEVVEYADRKYVVDNDIMSGLRMAHIEWIAFKKFGEKTPKETFLRAVSILKMRFNESRARQPVVNLFTVESSKPGEYSIKDFEGTETKLLDEYLRQSPELTVNSIIIATDAHKSAGECAAHLFHIMRRHFEYVMMKFIEMRNIWITKHGLPDELNNIDELLVYWKQILEDAGVTNVTSVPLLFLNLENAVAHRSMLQPLATASSRLELNITGLASMKKLLTGIDAFYYPGMCVYEPAYRYSLLMQFPILEFAAVLREIWPDYDLPDYEEIAKQREEIRKNFAKSMDEFKTSVRNTKYQAPKAPRDASVTWYVDEIFKKFFAFKHLFRKIEQLGIHRMRSCGESLAIYRKFNLA